MVSGARRWWRQAEAARAFGMARQIVVVTDIQDGSSGTGARSLRDESAGLAFLMTPWIWVTALAAYLYRRDASRSQAPGEASPGWTINKLVSEKPPTAR